MRTLPNTFACFRGEKEMTKYFFLSLVDTISFLNTTYQTDLTRGLNFNYAIFSLDIPVDIIKNYLGVGFYGPQFNWTQLEVCLPYILLKDLVSSNNNPNFTEAMQLYNASFTRYIYDEEIGQKLATIKENIPDKLMIKGTNPLYPYLCFPITNYQLWLLSNPKWLKLAWQEAENLKNLIREENYLKNINTILNRQPYSLRFNPQFSKEDLFEYTEPIITTENEELQKILTKKEIPFLKR